MILMRVLTGVSMHRLRVPLAVTVLTIAGFVVLASVLVSGLLDKLAMDGAVDRRRLLSSVLLYGAGLNAAAWLPALWRHYGAYKARLLLGGVSMAAVLLVLRLLAPMVAPSVVLPEFGQNASARYHHVIPPDATFYYGTFEGKTVVVRTNEDGLRSGYSRRSFLRRGTRLAVLGDSFTFGLGVRDDKIWPAILERRLREEFPQSNVGVINAGVNSYSPLLSLLQFRGVVESYEPHVVMLMIDATDVGDDWRYSNELVAPIESEMPFGRSAPARPALSPLEKLMAPARQQLASAARYPFELVVRRFLPLGSAAEDETAYEPYRYYDFRLEIGGTVESNRFFIYRHPPDLTSQYFEACYSNVFRLQEACRRIGAELVVVPVPRFHHWNPRECPDNWEKRFYALDEPFQHVYLEFFAERPKRDGISVFPLIDAFRRTGDFPLVFRRDPHWNERGHRLVAGAMADYLRENHAYCFERSKTFRP